MAAQTSRRAAGSRPWVSSSRITRRGLFSSASTRNSRCRSPPLSDANAERRRAASPNCSSSSAPSRPCGVRNNLTASATRSRSGSAESCSWLPTCGRNSRGLGHRVEAEHAERAGVRLAQALQAFHRRCLAGPVRADQPHDLAERDIEVEIVHDHSVPVGLAQTSDGHYIGVSHVGNASGRAPAAHQPASRTRSPPWVRALTVGHGPTARSHGPLGKTKIFISNGPWFHRLSRQPSTSPPVTVGRPSSPVR